MLGKNAANPLRICEYFNEAEPRSAPSKSGSDTHALLNKSSGKSRAFIDLFSFIKYN